MQGFEPERVCRLEKQYGVLFFRQSAKSVTESFAFSRQARQYVAVCRHGRSNPVRVTTKETSFVYQDKRGFLLIISTY